MRVTHKQLVDLVLPVLDTACEEWRNRITEAIEAVGAGEGLELDEYGRRAAVWWAARHGHVNFLRPLLASGVSQDVIDDAAWAASTCGHIECLKLLLASGVSQTGIDEAARWARWEGNLECLKLLEEAKAKEE